MLYPTELRAQPFNINNLHIGIANPIDFLILPEMEDQRKPVWQKTQYANVIRYVPSGTFYARIRIQGKLIRKSLETDLISVAKLRLGDLEKTERQAVESKDSVANGRMPAFTALKILPFYPAPPENGGCNRPKTSIDN